MVWRVAKAPVAWNSPEFNIGLSWNEDGCHESRFQEAAKTTVGPLHSARSLLPMHSVASYNVFFLCPTFLARTWDSIGNDQLTHGPLGPYKLLPEVKSNLTWWSSSCNMAALPVPERSSKSWSGISISIRSKCFQSMFTSLLPKHQQGFWGALEAKKCWDFVAPSGRKACIFAEAILIYTQMARSDLFLPLTILHAPCPLCLFELSFPLRPSGKAIRCWNPFVPIPGWLSNGRRTTHWTPPCNSEGWVAQLWNGTTTCSTLPHCVSFPSAHWRWNQLSSIVLERGAIKAVMNSAICWNITLSYRQKTYMAHMKETPAAVKRAHFYKAIS